MTYFCTKEIYSAKQTLSQNFEQQKCTIQVHSLLYINALLLSFTYSLEIPAEEEYGDPSGEEEGRDKEEGKEIRRLRAYES
jgi:hypothetical protein